MICRLCLFESEQYKCIFGPEGCEEEDLTKLINKYLYLEIAATDPISTFICNSCWDNLQDFHIFYGNIEEAQKKLSDGEFLKDEDASLCSIESFEVGDASLGGKEDYHNESINQSLQASTPRTDSDNESFTEEKQENIKIESLEIVEYKSPIEENENTQDLPNNDKGIKRKRGRPKKTSMENINTSTTRRERLRRRAHISNCNEPQEIFNASSSPKATRNKKVKKEKTDEPSEFVKKCREINENIAQYMRMQCELCPIECATFSQMRSHYREKHKCPGYIICCNKKFYRPGFLWEHINKHINPNYFRCELCDKTYADKNSLKTHHVIMHTPDEKKIHKCDVCSKCFPKIYMLENHKLIHMPREERKYICQRCGKGFPSRHMLQNHIRQIHENAYGTMCHICAKVLHNKAMLVKHQLEHAGIVEPKVQCQECGAWLKNKYGLKKHMNRHTERQEDLMNPKEYTCDFCGKISTTRAGLRSHIQYNHQLKPKHQCSVCNKSFKSPKSLKEHMTTHTGEVLYTCPHCPKTFNSNANMHSHRKKKHREEWEARRKDKEKMREQFKMDLVQKIEEISTNRELDGVDYGMDDENLLQNNSDSYKES